MTRFAWGVSAVLGTVVLLCAAFTPSAEAANGWQQTGPLAGARANHTATLLPDGKLLVSGGRDTQPLGVPLASAELYDPSTGTWSATGSMGVARSGHTATLLTGPACASNCGKVLVAGGAVTQTATAGVEVTETAELYDPVAQTWAPAGSMAAGRTAHTASLLHGPACDGPTPPTWCGKVLAAGGTSTAELASAELFDPATATWAPTGALTTARTEHTATVLGDGTVLAVGGRNTADPLVNPILFSAERFDPATGTWASAGSTVIARAAHTATLLPSGRVLVVGGIDSFAAPRRSSELYDPAAAPGAAWLSSPSLTDGRGHHTATLFPDASVLVVGGGAQNLDRTSSERHRAAPEPRWTFDAPLRTSRQQHTATLLTGTGCAPSCGKLLVVGGLRQVSTFLASAELYGPLPPVTPPAPTPVARSVTNLAARALSSRAISLTFSAPSPSGEAVRPARRYVVKQARVPITAANFAKARSLCGGTCTFSPGRAGDRITLRVQDLVPNRGYYYALRALDSAGRPGALSNVARARTSKDALRPGRPRGLSARALTRGRVKLSFRAPASDGRAGPPVRRFAIKQATRPIDSSRSFRRARSLCRSTCRFAPARVGARLTLGVRRLCPGRRYYYAIRAKDEGGNLSRLTRFRAVRAKGPRRSNC